MAVLNINWSSSAPVAPVNDKVVTPKEGEEAAKKDSASKEDGKETAAPVKLADKPFLIYIADAAATENFDKVEKVVLTDDKVLVGSKAFTCIRLSPEQAAQNKLVADAGKEVPRIVFVTVDYKDTTVIEGGKLTVGALWDTMQKQYKKAYDGDLEKNVKAMMKVLGEFDKVSGARKVQEEKEAREPKPTAADKAEWSKTKEELDERQKKAEKERDELLKFVRKTKLAA